ncbi:hypothetical protein B0H19DRAFT_109702, partial [Mycena capillaripes]
RTPRHGLGLACAGFATSPVSLLQVRPCISPYVAKQLRLFTNTSPSLSDSVHHNGRSQVNYLGSSVSDDFPDLQTLFGAKITECESIIQYSFSSKLLCAEALNTASGHSAQYLLDGEVHTMPLNNRLAIYGQAVALAHLCRLWLDEGRTDTGLNWYRIHMHLLSRDNFGFVCLQRGLSRCINWSDHRNMESKQKLATTVKAVLGAVYIDGKEEALGPVMLRLGFCDHPYMSHHNGYGYSKPTYRNWLKKRAKARKSEYGRWIMERKSGN